MKRERSSQKCQLETSMRIENETLWSDKFKRNWWKVLTCLWVSWKARHSLLLKPWSKSHWGLSELYRWSATISLSHQNSYATITRVFGKWNCWFHLDHFKNQIPSVLHIIITYPCHIKVFVEATSRWPPEMKQLHSYSNLFRFTLDIKIPLTFEVTKPLLKKPS